MSDRGKASFTTMDFSDGVMKNKESGDIHAPNVVDIVGKGFEDLEDTTIITKMTIADLAATALLVGAPVGAGVGAISSEKGKRKEGAKRGAKYGAVGGILGHAPGAAIGGYLGRETENANKIREAKLQRKLNRINGTKELSSEITVKSLDINAKGLAHRALGGAAIGTLAGELTGDEKDSAANAVRGAVFGAGGGAIGGAGGAKLARRGVKYLGEKTLPKHPKFVKRLTSASGKAGAGAGVLAVGSTSGIAARKMNQKEKDRFNEANRHDPSVAQLKEISSDMITIKASKSDPPAQGSPMKHSFEYGAERIAEAMNIPIEQARKVRAAQYRKDGVEPNSLKDNPPVEKGFVDVVKRVVKKPISRPNVVSDELKAGIDRVSKYNRLKTAEGYAGAGPASGTIMAKRQAAGKHMLNGTGRPEAEAARGAMKPQAPMSIEFGGRRPGSFDQKIKELDESVITKKSWKSHASRAAFGGAIGSAVGAGTSDPEHTKEGALRGGLLGAAVGGGVGAATEAIAKRESSKAIKRAVDGAVDFAGNVASGSPQKARENLTRAATNAKLAYELRKPTLPYVTGGVAAGAVGYSRRGKKKDTDKE